MANRPFRRMFSKFLFFATPARSREKRRLAEFENIRRNGLFAINLREGDELVGVHLTDGNQEVVLGTKHGMAIRFPEQEVGKWAGRPPE